MIELRAHHLLCILTLAGKGYSPGFVAKFRSVARFIKQGMPVKIIAGPDELCACVIAEDSEPHCYSASVTARDLTAARDVGDKLGIVIEPGTILTFDNQTIAEMRSWFRNGITRSACIACQWHEVCTQLVENDFTGCTLGGTRG